MCAHCNSSDYKVVTAKTAFYNYREWKRDLHVPVSSILRGGGAGRALGFLQGVIEWWSDGAAGGGEEVWGVVAREHGRLTGLWTHEVIVDMLMLGAGRRRRREKMERKST